MKQWLLIITLAINLQVSFSQTDSLSEEAMMPDTTYESGDIAPVNRWWNLNDSTAKEIFRQAERDYGGDRFIASADKYNTLIQEQGLPYFWLRKGQCEVKALNFKDAVVSFTNCIENLSIEPILTFNKQVRYKEANPRDLFEKPMFTKYGIFCGYEIDKDGAFIGRDLQIFTTYKYQPYLLRAQAKTNLSDYYGSLKDLAKYHKVSRDSGAYSCYLMGFCLQAINKTAQSKKYYDVALRLADSDDLIAEILYQRGFLLLNLKQLQQACEDWSTAGEKGVKKAYDAIRENCYK